MPRPREVEPAALAGSVRLGIGRHDVPPGLVVTVADEQAHGAAEGPTVPDAAQDLDRVGLDLHSPAAAVAPLAPPQVGVDRLPLDRHACWKALDDDGQGRAM